jgi:hypothetical protein
MDGYGLGTEEILTHVTIHWLTGTGGSAIRIYAEAQREDRPGERTTVPVGVAQFPGTWLRYGPSPSTTTTSFPGTATTGAVTTPPMTRPTCS